MQSLVRALSALESATARLDDEAFMQSLDEVACKAIKWGVIHYFEMAFDQSCKAMEIWIEANMSPHVTSGISRRELFRMAAEARLILDVEMWFKFHDVRMRTPDVMDEENAARTITLLPAFIQEAECLQAEVESRR